MKYADQFDHLGRPLQRADRPTASLTTQQIYKAKLIEWLIATAAVLAWAYLVFILDGSK